MNLSELEFVVFCFAVVLAYWASAYEARQFRALTKDWGPSRPGGRN